MLEMPIADALSRYLSMATQQMRLTAANMANVDTPGYKTTGMDFQGEFAKSLHAHGATPAVASFDVPDLVSRPDGNNVSVDRESTTMAATQLQFRTGIELLRHEYSSMMDAIKSEGK